MMEEMLSKMDPTKLHRDFAEHIRTGAPRPDPVSHVATGEGAPVGWLFGQIPGVRPWIWQSADGVNHYVTPDPATYTAAVLAPGTPILPEDHCVGDWYLDKVWKQWIADGPMANASSFAWYRPNGIDLSAHPTPEPVPTPAIDAAHPPEGYRHLAAEMIPDLCGERANHPFSHSWERGYDYARFRLDEWLKRNSVIALPLEPAPTVEAGPVLVDPTEWDDIQNLIIALSIDEDAFERLDDLLDPIATRRYLRDGAEWIDKAINQMGRSAPPAAAPDPRDARIAELASALRATLSCLDSGAERSLTVYARDAARAALSKLARP